MRCDVALGDGFGLKACFFFGVGEEVIFAGEIGEEVLVLEGELLGDAGVAEETALVIADFADGGFKVDAGVPGSAARVVEASAGEAGMGEGGVDDSVGPLPP